MQLTSFSMLVKLENDLGRTQVCHTATEMATASSVSAAYIDSVAQ